MSTPVTLTDVKSLEFVRSMPSEDGEKLLLEVKDPTGRAIWIAIDWSHAGVALQMIQNAAEKCGARRKELGKSNLFTGREKTARLVQTFQVTEYDGVPLKVLSLQDPSGLRCDFAVPTNTADQLGRPTHKAIAEELLRDQSAERKRPN